MGQHFKGQENQNYDDIAHGKGTGKKIPKWWHHNIRRRTKL